MVVGRPRAAETAHGTGWADVALALVEWAKYDPGMFLLVAPLFILGTAGGLALVYRALVVEPRRDNEAAYKARRNRVSTEVSAKKRIAGPKIVRAGREERR